MENLIDFNLLKEYDSTLKEVLKVWQKQKSYSVGDTVQYKGNYLKCTTAGTSGTTTLDFTGVEVGDTITDGTVLWEIIEPPSGSGNGLNDWVANTQYKIDSIVVNNGQIYKALVEFTSGSTFENIEILEDYTLQTGDTPIPWAEGTEISINDIVSYDGKYYKALIYFTCGSTFTKNVFEEYVPKSLTDEQIDAIVDNYNPVYSAATGVEYSTEEQRIGTWIDGKPLYQKTYVSITPSKADTNINVVNVTDLNISIVVNLSGVIYYDAGDGYMVFVPINSPRVTQAQHYSWFYTGYNSGSCAIKGQVGSTLVNKPVHFEIQYTKTTD